LMIRPTVCQLIRVSRTVVVVSHLVISHATRSSKSRVNRAPSRANGDAFHQRAVLRAAQASEPGVDLQAPDPEIEVAPDRVVTLLALAMTRAVRALRAPQPTSPQRDRDQHPVRLKTDRADRHAGQAQQTRECARDAHRDRPPVRRTQKPRAYGLNLCASPNPPSRNTPASSEEAASAQAHDKTALSRRQSSAQPPNATIPVSAGSDLNASTTPSGRVPRP
jgi:hypothetical protein